MGRQADARFDGHRPVTGNATGRGHWETCPPYKFKFCGGSVLLALNGA